MKKLVSLMVLIGVLFSFWSCNIQENEDFEESQESIASKPKSNTNICNFTTYTYEWEISYHFSYIDELDTSNDVFPNNDRCNSNNELTLLANCKRDFYLNRYDIRVISTRETKNEIIDIWRINLWECHCGGQHNDIRPNHGDRNILEADLNVDLISDEELGD